MPDSVGAQNKWSSWAPWVGILGLLTTWLLQIIYVTSLITTLSTTVAMQQKLSEAMQRDLITIQSEAEIEARLAIVSRERLAIITDTIKRVESKLDQAKERLENDQGDRP